MSRWDFPCVPRSLQSLSMPGYQSPCLQWLVVWPYSLFLLQSLNLSFAPWLFLSIHFSGTEKGGNNLKKQHDSCCPDSKWKGRQNEQAASVETVEIALKAAAVAAPFSLMSVAGCHLIWSQLPRYRRQTPFGFEFPQDCFICPAQERIWKKARLCLTPFSLLLLILFFGCFHVFPVEKSAGAELLWLQMIVVELQSTQHQHLKM